MNTNNLESQPQLAVGQTDRRASITRLWELDTDDLIKLCTALPREYRARTGDIIEIVRFAVEHAVQRGIVAPSRRSEPKRGFEP